MNVLELIENYSPQNLVERLPPGMHPYARLMRIDRPVGTWLLLLPCWWGTALASPGFPSLWFLFLFSIGAFVMRGAGCVINDIYDRNLDRLVERTQSRPLASGEIALWQAVLFLALLLFIGLCILLLFNRATVTGGAISLLLVVTYPLMKRLTWWPQLFLGLTFNWGILMGGSAVTATIPFANVLAYAAAISWTLAYDTIYACQDVRDDAVVGIKSTARLFGTKSLPWVTLFYAGTIVGLALAGWADHLHKSFYIGLLIAACFAAVQLIVWRPSDPENCLGRFQANRNFGLIIFVAILCGKIL